MDESIWADTPYSESDLQEQYDRARRALRTGRRADPKRRQQLRRRRQQVHLRGLRQPDEAARRVQPDRSVPEHLPAGAPVEGRRRDRDRLAGRRDLRQGRRRRARRSPSPSRRPRSGSAPARARRSGPTSSRSTTPRRRPPSTARASPTASRPPSARGVALPDPGTRPARERAFSPRAAARRRGELPRLGGGSSRGLLKPLPAAPRRLQRAARLGARVEERPPRRGDGSAGRATGRRRS